MKKFNSKIKNYANALKLAGAITAYSLLPNNSMAQKPNNPEQIRKVQQEFSSKPSAIQLDKVYDWYNRSVDDSLEIVVFGNNALYNISNATIKTNPESGIGSITEISDDFLKINNIPYVKMTMVGESGARFRNEKTENRDYTTTFPSMFNALKLNDEEAKNVLGLYTGWRPDEISINRNENGDVINTTYSGPSNRYIIRNRELDDGTSVEHARWMPGTDAQFPLEKVLNFVGYDINLANELKEKHGNRDDYLNELQAKLDSSNQVIANLKIENAELSKSADSLAVVSDSLKSTINKWDVSPIVGINSKLTPELGLYATVGKLGVGTIYTLPTNELVSEFEDETRSTPPQGRPNQAISIRNSATKNYLDKHRIEGLIGYELSPKFTIFGTAGIERGKKTESITDHFWQEVPGPYGSNHIINEQLEQPKVISKNYTSPIVGLGAAANLTDRLKLYLRGTFMPENNNVQGSIGLKYNLRKNQNK